MSDTGMCSYDKIDLHFGNDLPNGEDGVGRDHTLVFVAPIQEHDDCVCTRLKQIIQADILSIRESIFYEKRRKHYSVMSIIIIDKFVAQPYKSNKPSITIYFFFHDEFKRYNISLIIPNVPFSISLLVSQRSWLAREQHRYYYLSFSCIPLSCSSQADQLWYRFSSEPTVSTEKEVVVRI